MSEIIRSWHEQLVAAEENLRLIRERRAEYVLETDVPLQIIKEERRLEAQVADLRARLARLAEAPCPYRGLLAFREQDAPFFFGREAFTERLVQAVRGRVPVAVVVGPSGSGKSSVVFAGLLPRLHQMDAHRPAQDGGWAIGQFRPGSHPFDELANALLPLLEPEMSRTDLLVEVPKLARALRRGDVTLSRVVAGILGGQSEAGHLLLVVDQFEELYTLCSDPETRHAFLDCLFQAISAASSPPSSAAPLDGRGEPALRLVLTLRADFLGQALAYRPSADVLDRAQKLMLGPMTREEMEAAIVRPAGQQGVAFEDGLVTRILDDVGREPGNLPLLEFALAQLWERQEEGRLTHAAYEAIGGVEGALTRYAEDVYSGLRLVERKQARRVLGRLVRPGEGTVDTRRVSARAELGEGDWALAQRLAGARLVVTGRTPDGRETAEVVHEALIWDWGRLRGWLDEDREFLLWRQRLRTAMAEWRRTGNDEGALLRGASLAEAEHWLDERPDGLGRSEREYIYRGVALRDRERAARDRERAARERLRRWSTLVLLAGLVVTLTLVVLLRSQLRRTEEQRQIALARQLAAQALDHMDDQYDLALLLSLEANRIADLAGVDLVEVKGSLLAGLTSSPHLVTFLRRHDAYVYSVAFSPADATRLASGSRDGTVMLWDAKSHQPVWGPLTGHIDAVNSVAFSRDGQMLASASRDGTIVLWDAATGERVGEPLTDDGAAVYSVAFDPNGQVLASSGAGEDHAVVLWDIGNGGRISRSLIGHKGSVQSVAFSPDGRTLASGSQDNTIMLWDVASGQPIGEPLVGHDGNVNSVAFGPDGEVLASGSYDQRVFLWEIGGDRPISHTLGSHAADVFSVAFSPDGRWLVSGGRDHQVIVWDVERRRHWRTMTGHAGPVRSVAFSLGGERLASGSADGSIGLWNITRSRLGRPLAGHKASVFSVAFSPDGRTLASASASRDNTIILWDAAAGDRIGRPLAEHRASVYSVAFSPDGQMLASGSEDNTVVLWDVASGQPVTQPLTGYDADVYSVAFSPDGRTLASGSGSRDRTIVLWDIKGGVYASRVLTGHQGSVYSVAFSPDGEMLASGSRDDTVMLWDVATGQAAGEPLTGHEADVYSVAFSPDGRMLASGSQDDKIILWDVATGQPIGEPLVGHIDEVRSVAFSPDGRMLASGGLDNRVVLWDVAARQPFGLPLSGHTWDVYSVVFGPDGQTLASAGRDGTVILWDIHFESWRSRACGIAARNLTREEWLHYLGDPDAAGYQDTCQGLP